MTSGDRLFHVLFTLGVGGVAITPCSGCSDSGGSSKPNVPGGDSGGSSGSSNVRGTGAVGAGGAMTSSSGAAGSVAIGEGGAMGFQQPCDAGTTCEHTQQLFCRQYVPAPMCCHCVSTAPLVPEDCSGSAQFICMSYDPPTGCDCVHVTGPR